MRTRGQRERHKGQACAHNVNSRSHVIPINEKSAPWCTSIKIHHKPNSYNFSSPSCIEQTCFGFTSLSLVKIGLFVHVVYSAVDQHCLQCGSTTEYTTWTKKPNLTKMLLRKYSEINEIHQHMANAMVSVL